MTEKKIDEEQASTMVPEKSHGHRGRKAGAIYFPRDSLTTALKVSQVIWEKNAGNPFSLLDVAAKVGNSPTSSSFRELIRSANRYGLINESFTQDLTKTISLSPLGTSIVAPTPTDNVNALKRKALETPDLFQKVLTSLNGKVLPDVNEVKNMLIRNYHLDKADAEACYEVLTQNISELGLSEDIQGKAYLRLDKLGSATVQIVSPETTERSTEPQPTEQLTPITEKDIHKEKIIPRAFISHSKNKKILEQLKEMLKFGEFEFRIAEEKETTAIPISDKVFGLMRECNCAIINISADDEMKQSDDSYRINENVLIEIGGAFIHYDKRVILLVDKRLTLPSNLQGLYRCEYEGDELSWTVAMKLQKALAEFKEKI